MTAPEVKLLPLMGPEEKRYPMQAQVWWRESTQEWVLSIYGAINDTWMECRHPAPGHISPEDVPGLSHVYEATTPLEARIAALEGALGEARKALDHIAEYWNRDRNDTAMHNACWHAINTADDTAASLRAMLADDGETK
jgi:hypothetical protein